MTLENTCKMVHDRLEQTIDDNLPRVTFTFEETLDIRAWLDACEMMNGILDRTKKFVEARDSARSTYPDIYDDLHG